MEARTRRSRPGTVGRVSDFPPPPPPGGYEPYGYGYVARSRPDYAGFWIRFLALVIDSFVLGIPLSILRNIVVSGHGALTFGQGYAPGNPPGWNLFTIAVGMLYYGLLEGGVNGQTIGKRIFAIRVVDVDTVQPGIGTTRGIGRYFARWLSAIPFGLGYFWMLWDPRRQAWQDKLARTLVIKA